MIIFVPAYDVATRANYAVARDLSRSVVTKTSLEQLMEFSEALDDAVEMEPAPHADQWLLGAEATRELLMRALRAHDGPLFAMTHGKPHCLFEQDHGEAVLASDAQTIKGRTVFAFACHTAAALGHDMAHAGVTWWGYIIEVSAPDDRLPFRKLFVEMFDYIRGAFAGADSEQKRHDVLLRIKELCDRSTIVVDNEADADPLLDVMDTLRSLRDTWQLLRIWSPGATSAERHPHAPDVAPRTFWL